MTIGDKGLTLIKAFENLKLKSYPDIAGIWTIGWGTTRLNGYPVGPNMEINEIVATALLMGDLQPAQKTVESFVNKSLDQNQFDALTSFVYNAGPKAFATSSLLVAIKLNGNVTEDLFTTWNKYHDGKVLRESQGLTNRRKAEYKLYIS